MNVSERLQKARVKLLTTSNANLVFVAHLCSVQDVLDSSVDTACTNGREIRWNPEFVGTLSDAEVFGVLIHELFHVGLLHTVIAKQYEAEGMQRLNIAADLAINSIIKDIGETLPESALMPGKDEFAAFPAMLSMEEYLRLMRDMDDSELPEQQPGGIEPTEDKDGEPNGMAEETVRAAVRHAAEKQEAIGKASANLKSAIKAASTRSIDFRTELKKYKNKLTRGGVDYNRPNRRLMAAGIYAPRNKTRAVGDVLLLVDVSGSMSDETISKTAAEIVGLYGAICGNLYIWQHDTDVLSKTVWKRGDKMPVFSRDGSGGTSHVPAFKEIAESGLKPAVIVCISDMYSFFPSAAPECSVVWITDRPGRPQPPFGVMTRTTL